MSRGVFRQSDVRAGGGDVQGGGTTLAVSVSPSYLEFMQDPSVFFWKAC